MTRIKLTFAALIAALTALWLAADTIRPAPLTYFSVRPALIQYTGIITVGAMSVALVLALRPRLIEPHLDGLDKMYRLHKWLGITAVAFGAVHWWWAKGTKWMVEWGLLVRPEHGSGTTPVRGPVESFLHAQHGLATFAGEWAFYAAVLLIFLALWQRFPYHLFRKTHKWLAALWLVLAWHSLVLLEFDYWARPIGWAITILLLAGSLAAFAALLGHIGRGRKVQGSIESITHYPALRVHEGSIRLTGKSWPGHRAGQFAYVTSRRSEGAHPYTIASAWDPEDPRLVVIAKELGDHTNRLKDHVTIGTPVTVEGPYGCFDFRGHHPCQIWIGAGIGITPFIARMKYLAHKSSLQKVWLFYPTAGSEQGAIDRLTAAAQAADVHFRVIIAARDGRLSGERIRAEVPGWQSASVWFCGPADFGEMLRRDLVGHGLHKADFHQELFRMR